MSKQPQADQKQQRDRQQGAQEPKSQPQQGTNKDQAPSREKPNQQGPNDRSSAVHPTKGFDRDESQRMQRDNVTTDNDDATSPRMDEGEEAPSVRRGALNTQYDGEKSQTGKPGAALSGPDDRAIDKERSAEDEQDTLAGPRGTSRP